MSILDIFTILIAFVNIFLGGYVHSKNPKNPNNRAYAFAVGSIAIWVFATFFYNNPVFLNAKEWLILVYLASYLMLISQAILVYYFPERSKKKFLLILGLILLTIIPSFYVLVIQDSVIISAQYLAEQGRSIAQMGSGYFIYTVPNLLGILILSIYFLLKGRRFTGFNKVQIQYYTIGALCMMLPIVFIDYIVPLIWDTTEFYIYGPIFVIPFSFAVAYSLIQSRFIDVKTVLYRIIILVEEILFFVIAFFLLYRYTEEILNEGHFLKSIGFILVIAPLAILIFRQYTALFRKFLKFVILEQKRTPEEIITRFSKANSVELETEKIAITVRTTIQELLGIKRVGIFLLNTSNNKVLYQYLHNLDLNGTRDLLEVIHFWDELNQDPILVTDEIKREIVFGKLNKDKRISRILSFLDKNKISAILPLNRETQLNGVLILGYKDLQMPLSVREIEDLELLIAQTSVAMGRSLLYKEVEELNKSLKEKVSEQTKELQLKVKQLEEARRKEADMIDIMGHELRTPMSVVKLNTDLLHNFTDNIEKRKEDFKKYIKRIRDSVDTEIRLINTLLSSAKLEGDKIEIHPEKVNIHEQIEMALHAQETRAKRKDVDLNTNFSKEAQYVFADHARSVEVLNNLIDNAVKYTEEGSVLVSTELEGDFVKISVTDTGFGMTEEDIRNLGKKFFRTSNYTQSEYSDDIDIVRPGGTGLGLYVTFNLVSKMGGIIDVKSKPGEGSTFSFTLPRYSGQKNKPIKGNKDMFTRLGLKE
jgi:signal transduction histidine kinase